MKISIMHNIAFFQVAEWEKDYLKANNLFGQLPVKVDLDEDKLTLDKLSESVSYEAVSVFVDSEITEEVLDKMPELKIIATRSTGYDHIDLEACRARGVAVANVPTYGENTVAEFTFGLILTLTRKIYDAYNRIREDGDFSLNGLTGIDLAEKKLGVIGTGKIGQNVIKIANGFGMEVLATDVDPDHQLAEGLGFSYVDLDVLLKESDIISLHVPYTEDNHHLINSDTLNQMKPEALLINTARGGLVSTQDLLRALNDKVIAGAALDVLEEEGVVKDEISFLTGSTNPSQPDLKTVLANHLLIDMPQVIITPHSAFNTQEALIKITTTSVDNIKSFLIGEPKNLVS